MNNRNIKSIFIAFALLALSACEKTDTPAVYPAVGDRMPSFRIETENGGTFSDTDLSAGESILVFFHTSCPDCRKELELLRAFYDKYHDEIRIVLISRGEGKESVDAYWKEHGYTMPFIAREDRYPYKLFSDKGIPCTVYSIDGVIRGLWKETAPDFIKL